MLPTVFSSSLQVVGSVPILPPKVFFFLFKDSPARGLNHPALKRDEFFGGSCGPDGAFFVIPLLQSPASKKSDSAGPSIPLTATRTELFCCSAISSPLTRLLYFFLMPVCGSASPFLSGLVIYLHFYTIPVAGWEKGICTRWAAGVR